MVSCVTEIKEPLHRMNTLGYPRKLIDAGGGIIEWVDWGQSLLK